MIPKTETTPRWLYRFDNFKRAFGLLQEATGRFKAIEDLSRYPDWTLQVANIPAVITCTQEMADQHPELVVTFMKGMIKVGRWANEHKHAAAAILDKQTFYADVEDTYRGIKDIDMVPNLSPQNLASIEIGKDFMVSHGYVENDFDVHEGERYSYRLCWDEMLGQIARLTRGEPHYPMLTAEEHQQRHDRMLEVARRARETAA